VHAIVGSLGRPLNSAFDMQLAPRMMRPRPDFIHGPARPVEPQRRAAGAVRHCFAHPLRRAVRTWKDEYVCEDCWRRLREIESAGF